MQIAERLAEHVVVTGAQDVPSHVVRLVSHLCFDYLGVAYRGASTETGVLAREVAVRAASPGSALVIGTSQRTDAEAAAFANAVASHSIEMDDCDDEGFYHVAPVVVSAALAVAEELGSDGQSFVTAVALGAEIMERLSRGLNPGLRDRGFHTTPVCGIFGAVAAVAKLYRLRRDEIVCALGLAGAFASGLMEFYGPSMQKRVNPAAAAQGAVRVVRLAQRGFTGASTIFEGARGVFRAFAGQDAAEAVTAGLGSDFPVSIGFKMYACARPIHTAVHAALRLRPELPAGGARVSKVVLKRHPRWAHYHLASDPRSYHEAQMSVKWSTALALVAGRASVDDYLEHEENEEVRNLAGRVEVEADAGLASTLGTTVEVYDGDGRCHTATELHPVGSAMNPCTREQLIEKFCHLTRVRAGAAADLLSRAEALNQASHVGDALFSTLPAPGGSDVHGGAR